MTRNGTPTDTNGRLIQNEVPRLKTTLKRRITHFGLSAFSQFEVTRILKRNKRFIGTFNQTVV